MRLVKCVIEYSRGFQKISICRKWMWHF